MRYLFIVLNLKALTVFSALKIGLVLDITFAALSFIILAR